MELLFSSNRNLTELNKKKFKKEKKKKRRKRKKRKRRKKRKEWGFEIQQHLQEPVIEDRVENTLDSCVHTSVHFYPCFPSHPMFFFPCSVLKE